MELASILPVIWSHDRGFNFDILFYYAVFFLVTWKPAWPFIEAFTRLLKAKVNTIAFTIPWINFRVDFSEYTEDDKFFDHFGAHLTVKVEAGQDEARLIKLKYQAKIAAAAAAKDHAALEAAIRESRSELEKLTDGILEEVQTSSDRLLWQAAVTRFGDKAKALQWIREKVKSIVERKKAGQSNLEVILAELKSGVSDLGKGPSGSEVPKA